MTTQPAATTTRERRGRTQSRGWPVPAALVALSAIPLAAGTLRLVQLAGGPELMPADDRFTGLPTALVVHITGAAIFALVGMFQFVPGIRRRHRAWHRRAGRVVAVAGLAVAGSALWLTLFYEAKPGTGDLLYVSRLVFASAMAGCLVFGFAAIRRRDIAAHRAWMIRGYAIGLAADTQAFTEGIGVAIFGTGVLAADLAKGAGWAINLAVAEWAIRRRPTRRRQPRPVTAPTPRRSALMSTSASTTDASAISNASTRYEFHVSGHLDDHWASWLDGTSTLTGTVADQAQLHGVLARLRDIGAALLAVHATGNPTTPTTPPPALEHPLQTQRLTLRPATAADAAATFAYRRLDAVGRWLTEVPTDLQSYRATFTEPARLATTIVVELDSHLIGDFMLRVEPRPRSAPAASPACWSAR